MASRVTADFSVIKFVECKSESFVNLPKFFDAIVTGECLEIAQTDLIQILSDDLSINSNNVSEWVKLVFPEALAYYMTVWPGWQRFEEYNSGKLSRPDWYERFRQYLILKIRFVIKSAISYDPPEIITKDIALQTEVDYSNTKKKPYAPYSLCIAGPAPVLNNVVFVKSDAHILVKQYPEKPWQNLKLSELYNWPYISLEITLPDFSFTRTITHQVQRYMALTGDMVVLPEVNQISYVKKVSDTEVQQSFSHEFINCYFQQLNRLLKKMPKLNTDRILELQKLFSEFIQDILEIDMCEKTMCTYISVGYHMGKSKYIRNRKIINTKNKNILKEIINFYEIIIPQVELTLRSFNVLQDDNDKLNITFRSLNVLETKVHNNDHEADQFRNLILNCIKYSCTACNVSYTGLFAKDLISKHFSKVHKGEQSVLCYKCHQEFNIQQLASSRWAHYCN